MSKKSTSTSRPSALPIQKTRGKAKGPRKGETSADVEQPIPMEAPAPDAVATSTAPDAAPTPREADTDAVTSMLTRRELATVFADLNCRAARSTNTMRNLVVFRLACGCGLRVSEIAGLQLDDVVLDTPRPHLSLRAATKGKRARRVPLWWDAGTLADVAAWAATRRHHGARGGDPFVCSVQSHRHGKPLQRAAIRRRFLSACKVLGLARLCSLTIHHGRHTFISHALAQRTLAEVRDAAGHTNIAVTSIYLHVAVDDDGKVGDLFKAR